MKISKKLLYKIISEEVAKATPKQYDPAIQDKSWSVDRIRGYEMHAACLSQGQRSCGNYCNW